MPKSKVRIGGPLNEISEEEYSESEMASETEKKKDVMTKGDGYIAVASENALLIKPTIDASN
jgi:hypothetical protein